jgi:hypothetical protein
MTATILALDNHTPKQVGKNGHVEYGWSNSIQERILQFSFQLTRTNETVLQSLSIVLRDLLTFLKSKVVAKTILTPFSIAERQLARGHLSILYRMIGHTRDIISGKGECTLTYMMIYTWYDFFPELAQFALLCLVDLGDKKVHQYGSWKDIKYFCEYCKNQEATDLYHPLIAYAIQIMNSQLKRDDFTLTNVDTRDDISLDANVYDISLVAKWIPREKSSFGWLYEAFATNYFYNYVVTAITPEGKRKAILKCKTAYRKILSELNRKIDTLQIKQCGHLWSDIDFNKVTSISLSKQKKAFLNIKKDGTIRYPDEEDRIECAEHFRKRIQTALKGEVEMKGKRVGMADFTKQARELLISRNQDEIDLLNLQWRDSSSQNEVLGKMIAMVDVSGSMEGIPMEVAIALGIRIAENSTIGKRVMTFSSSPTWINLEPYTDFVSQVEVVSKAPWGMNTNFHAALDLILDAIIESQLEPEDVQDLVLVILSDMQMDSGDRCNKTVLYDIMKEKYEDAGIRLHGKPYKPPHILFWNLSSTTGFPALSNQPNCSMISGFSPVLLNLFCEKGLHALESCTPWSMLEQTLENERYKIMSDKLYEYI